MSEIKTKNSRSPIWSYFEPVDTKIARCLLCECTYRNSGNTTNLIDHLKRKHRHEYNLVNNETTNTKQQSDSNETEIPNAVNAINEKTEQEEEQQQPQQQQQPQSVENFVEQISEEPDSENQRDIQIVKIVPLPHHRSEVWNYFGFVADDKGDILDKTKAVCKICASTFCYSGNTTNFYSHLKSMHSEIQMRAVSSSVKSNRIKRTYSNMMGENNDIESDNENNTNSSSFGQNNSNINTSIIDDAPFPERSTDDLIYMEDITQCIVDFLVTDCRPLCVAQGRGFQRLLRLLAPGYSLPDRNQLSYLLRKRYNQLRKERAESATALTDFERTSLNNNNNNNNSGQDY